MQNSVISGASVITYSLSSVVNAINAKDLKVEVTVPAPVVNVKVAQTVSYTSSGSRASVSSSSSSLRKKSKKSRTFFPWFATGGFTGFGGKYDIAGIVHKGEVVFSQEDVRRAGGVEAVEMSRHSGGLVKELVKENRGLKEELKEIKEILFESLRTHKKTKNILEYKSA